MECSQCSRIWHAGGPECPTCGAPAIVAGTTQEGQEPEERKPTTFSRRDLIIGAVVGGAAASVAILLPVGLTEWTGDGDGGAAVADPTNGGQPAVVLATFERQKIASLSDLSPGEPFDFSYPLEGQTNFVVKLGAPATGGVGEESDIVAFSYKCTHMGCPLVGLYKQEHKILGPCACHFSTFDLTRNGVVVLGQATENLPQITLETDGDDLYATGVMGLIYGYRNNVLDGQRVEATA